MQISAAKLTEMDPMAREAAQGARAALGTDYEQQLRKAAGPMPGKLSKRKHQIGSLFHQAKLAVSLWCMLSAEVAAACSAARAIQAEGSAAAVASRRGGWKVASNAFIRKC